MIDDEDDKTDAADPAVESAPEADAASGFESFEGAETDPDSESLIDAFTAGGRLKAAREARGLSIDDMARKLFINQRVLESLEQTIQPPDYDMRRTRIVARNYATALGIPFEPVLADFPVEERADLATAIPKSSVTVSERGQRRYLLPAFVVTALVLVIGVSAVMLTPETISERRTTPSVAERIVAVNTSQESLFARAPLEQAETQPIELAIVATRPAWIEVRGEDGTIFRSRTMARGEVYYPRTDAGWSVTVQDGSAFEWRVGDAVIGQLAEEATPVYSASIDAAAAIARQQTSPAMAATTNSRPSR